MFQTSTCMSVCMSICMCVCSGACLHRCTCYAHSTHTYTHTQHTHHTIMHFPHNCSCTKSLSNSRAETSKLLGRISTSELDPESFCFVYSCFVLLCMCALFVSVCSSASLIFSSVVQPNPSCVSAPEHLFLG